MAEKWKEDLDKLITTKEDRVELVKFNNINETYKKFLYGKQFLRNLGMVNFNDIKPDNIITVEVEYDNRIIPGTFVHLMGFGEYSGIAYITKVNVILNYQDGIKLRLTMITDKMLQNDGLNIKVIEPTMFFTYSEKTIDPQFRSEYEKCDYTMRRSCLVCGKTLKEKRFNMEDEIEENDLVEMFKTPKNIDSDLYRQRKEVSSKRPTVKPITNR